MLAAAPTPAAAAKLTRGRVVALLKRSGRGNHPALVEQILADLHTPALRQPPRVEQALGHTVAGLIGIVVAMGQAVDDLETELAREFDQHPQAAILRSAPCRSLPPASWPRSATTPHDSSDPNNLRAFAGTAPVTIASGRSHYVKARKVRNKRLGDASHASELSSGDRIWVFGSVWPGGVVVPRLVVCQAPPQPAEERVGQVAQRMSEDALKPWQYQSWIFISDPDFAAKAQRVLDLYARVWDGEPLGRNDYVISADEKTSIQARCRCHPTLPPGKARMIRVNHDYHRRGAVAYLAAYDVHHAKVFGRCENTTGIVAFTNLVTQVMTREPYASADRVFWIVDNGSSHRGQAAIDRLAEQYPNAIMVHTPVHASWLNQIEIYFSIVQRKVLSPNDFTDLDDVVDRLSDFETRYNQTARPFKWKFTTTDLTQLLTRLDNHNPHHDPAEPRAA